MFVNGDAASVVIKLLAAGSLLLFFALVAHVVWIGRLAGSHALGRLGPAARIALLALAAAAPVVSFYGVGTALRLRRLARRRGLAGAARTVVGAVGALAVVVLGVLAVAQPWRPVTGPHGSDVLSRLPGMVLVLAVPCAVLGMACQVLVRPGRARMGWMVVAGAAATCFFLLV